MKDDVIDRVARSMTEGEPGAGFRARVLGRLPQASRGSWWRIAIPAGAITSLVIAWALTGPARSPGPGRSLAPAGSAGHAGPAGPETTAALGPAPAAPAAEALAERVDAAGPAAPTEPADSSVFEPIVIAPIQPILPTITPITVDPIIWDRIPH